MSVLLSVIGAIAVMAGAVMVGFGVPINEFSFGNTLIASGVTAFMGGLVILGLGAVVGQLQRVVEALAAQPPMRASRPMEAFEPPARAAAAPARVPFPSRPKADIRESRVADSPPDTLHDLAGDAAETIAPTLRNPDEPPSAAEESAGLPSSLPKKAASSFNPAASGSAEKRPEPAPDTGWRAPPPLPPVRPPQTGYFDTMWPAAEARQARTAPPPEPKHEQKAKPLYEPKSDFKAETKPDFKPEPPAESAPMAKPAEPEPAKPQTAGEKRAVAILKSGVVDGMGYTLYVDGSIEADLPQGTLRFASINELRSHLEKNP